MAITHTKGTLHGSTIDEKLYPKNFSDQVLNNNQEPATITATDETLKVARDINGNFVYAQPFVPKTEFTFSETNKPKGKNLGSITIVNEGTTDVYNISGGSSYTLEQATETTLGGIKASSKTDNETAEAKIGTDGKLYVHDRLTDLTLREGYNVNEGTKNLGSISFINNEDGAVEHWNVFGLGKTVETWTFTLEDGTQITKKVVIG